MMILCCFAGDIGEILAEKRKQKRQHFTPEEDKALIAAVQKYGPKNWEYVAKWLPGYNAR
jgi:hypothetical protein